MIAAENETIQVVPILVVATEERPTPVDQLEDRELERNISSFLDVVSLFKNSRTGQQEQRIKIQRLDGGGLGIRASRVVGVVGTKDLVVSIQPKIPEEHFYYLAVRGKIPARFSEHLLSLGQNRTPLDLIFLLFLTDLRHLLMTPLFTDYRQVEATDTWYGALDVMHVVKRYYQGLIEPRVITDELSPDMPVNRVLRAALHAISAMKGLDRYLVTTAQRMLPKFQGVGQLKSGDRRVSPARRMAHYRTTWTLANHILDGVSRTIRVGDSPCWCFLLPTPEIAENALRDILAEVLRDCRPAIQVAKGKIFTQPSTSYGQDPYFEPDLLFSDESGNRAVGDVKYKLAQGTPWENRADLNQALAFATAAGVKDALIVQFRDREPDEIPSLEVGSVTVRFVFWPTLGGDAMEARQKFEAQIRKWCDLVFPE